MLNPIPVHRLPCVLHLENSLKAIVTTSIVTTTNQMLKKYHIKNNLGLYVTRDILPHISITFAQNYLLNTFVTYKKFIILFYIVKVPWRILNNLKPTKYRKLYLSLAT